MSHPDDDRLREFLHEYRPDPPPAGPDLEQRVMEGIEIIPQQPQQPVREYLLQIRRPWLFSGALAASLLIALGGYRLLTPATPNLAKKANLEAFLVESWDGVMTDSQTAIYSPEAILSAETTSNN